MAEPTTSPTEAPTPEEISTWNQIEVTIYIAGITAALLLTLYEITRRSPAFRDVFDRKRQSRPKRTPPPLLTSHGGWCPAILEFLFVGLDEEYTSYSLAVNQKGEEYEHERARSRHKGGSVLRGVEDKEKAECSKDSVQDDGDKNKGPPPLQDAPLEGRDGPAQNDSSDAPKDDANQTPKPPSRLKQLWIPAGVSVKLPIPRNQDFGFLRARELTDSDRELLRCIGLDSFVMIRFLRFAFDCTFYPFLIACVTIIPTFLSNDYNGEFLTTDDGGFEATTTDGYFSITINKLQHGSRKLWVPCLYAIGFQFYALRRLWLEWVVFMDLRNEHLANGDPDAVKEDDEESLRQFRNSCLIEYVPQTHRRDKDLRKFFDGLFPGQVKHAEVLLETKKLTELMGERQCHIVQYENAYARQQHALAVHRRHVEAKERGENVGLCAGLSCRKSRSELLQPPKDEQARVGGFCCCCGGEKVSALPYHQTQIDRLNDEVEKEYEKVVKRKEKDDGLDHSRKASWVDLSIIFIPKEVLTVTGLHSAEGATDIAFLEFKTRTIKQTATQCNVSAGIHWMDTLPAPDPRDVLWQNVTIGRAVIQTRKRLMAVALIFGILFWGALIAFITSIFNQGEGTGDKTHDGGPNDDGSNFYSLVRGYLPALIIQILLAILPAIFNFLGYNIIRLRTRSEVDKFAFFWNTNYRIANVLVIIVSGTLWHTFELLGEDWQDVIRRFANGILTQSQFFFNLVLVQTGQGTMLQLVQLPSLGFQLLVKIVCTMEALSQRKIEWIQEPKPFAFGRFAPAFMYVFMIALIYCPMVPLITFASSAYFFVATKVYTHQTLFVFLQDYDGGGKLMYLINRAVFFQFYLAYLVFLTILALKQKADVATFYGVIALSMIVVFQYGIQRNFVEETQYLPLTRARILDEQDKATLLAAETEALIDDNRQGAEGELRGEEQADDDPLLHAEMQKVEDKRKAFAHAGHQAGIRKQTSKAGMGIGQPPLGFNVDENTDEAQVDYYLYRQPHLNKAAWETGPRPYRTAAQ